MSKRNANVRVQIYESEYKAIMAEARRLADTETGGDLYGTFTHGSNPIIWLASGPGPRTRHEQTHFEQDSAFTTYWEGRLTNEFGLQYIGSWHSHHFLGLQEPSSGDVGAAQLYAQQHNRQTTLEIIVNHRRVGTKRGEQQFDTILSPYFYPDAQNARAERFILATFVPLAGVSPIRQQLGTNELAAFNRISWQQAAEFQLPSALISQNARPQTTQTTNDDDAIIMPDILGVELQAIADDIQDFNIQQTSNAFLITITLAEGCVLALAVQKQPDLRIIQVNLIDRTRDINENISTKLHDEMGFHFSITGRNKGILRKLVGVAPSLHRKIAEQKRLEAIELERRRAKQLQEEQNRQKHERTSTGELLEMQKHLQEQHTFAQQLEVQWRKAQLELENLRIEARNQSENRELEIKQLTIQLATAQQRLTSQQENEQSLAALREASTQQQIMTEQKFVTLQNEVQTLESQLLDAQKELANQKLIEAQLNESRQQIDVEQHKAQILESRLADLQTQLTMHKQLEARLKDTQERLDVQQDEVSKLEKELNETKKMLESTRRETEKRHQHWHLIRNRGGPDQAELEENKENNPFTKFVFPIVLLIIVVVIVAILFALTYKSR